MKVIIEQERICIDSDCIRYSPHYLESWAEDVWQGKDKTSLDVMKQILQQWADTLTGMGIAYRRLYLPYSLEDETIECFEATTKSPPTAFKCNVKLRCVVVKGNGYSLDLGDLYQFMTSQHTIYEEFPADFGMYDKDEIVQSLSDAKTIST